MRIQEEVKISGRNESRNSENDILKTQPQITGEDYDNHLDKKLSEKQFFVKEILSWSISG